MESRKTLTETRKTWYNLINLWIILDKMILVITYLRLFLILLISDCEAANMLFPTRTEDPVEACNPTHHLEIVH